MTGICSSLIIESDEVVPTDHRFRYDSADPKGKILQVFPFRKAFLEGAAVQVRKHLGNSLRFSILSRDKYTCQYCGRRAPRVELHIEHMISVNDGGSNHPSNLVAACTDCNWGKGKRSLIIAEESGFEIEVDGDELFVFPLEPEARDIDRLLESVSNAHFEAVKRELETEVDEDPDAWMSYRDEFDTAGEDPEEKAEESVEESEFSSQEDEDY